MIGWINQPHLQHRRVASAFLATLGRAESAGCERVYFSIVVGPISQSVLTVSSYIGSFNTVWPFRCGVVGPRGCHMTNDHLHAPKLATIPPLRRRR
jgi:hypothetical protein